MLPSNLISDIEKAISTRSADAGTLLHRITDLFLLNVGHDTADQLDLHDETSGRFYNFRAAEQVVKSRELSEAVVNEFAKEKRIAELMVSIAQLSGLSVDEIERLFMDTWTSPVAIILKAIGFHLSTMEAIYRSRLPDGEVARNDLINTKAEFIALRRPTAERILRFFSARRAVKISNL